MSLIVAEVYDALIEAGTSEEKAKAAAGAIPLAERLATKEDLDELKAATKEDLDELKAATKEDLDELKAATKEDLDELKAATKEDLDALKASFNELKASFNERFAKIERDLALLKFGYGPVVLALLVKIAFF